MCIRDRWWVRYICSTICVGPSGESTSTETHLKFYKGMALPTLLYWSENWTLTKSNASHIQAAERDFSGRWQCILCMIIDGMQIQYCLLYTSHMYSFCTCLLRIWCSICRAFLGVRPNSRRPLVNRSSLWIVRRFFKWYSLARMKTTVLWRYRPQGWTCLQKLHIWK